MKATGCPLSRSGQLGEPVTLQLSVEFEPSAMAAGVAEIEPLSVAQFRITAASALPTPKMAKTATITGSHRATVEALTMLHITLLPKRCDDLASGIDQIGGCCSAVVNR